MYLLHNIGPKQTENYNTIEEIKAAQGPISFDGVYRSVYKHRFDLVGKDITLFVTGDYMGKDNRFDVGQPLEEFCNWNEIMEIVNVTGARIGWHTWSHTDLTTLDEAGIRKELMRPFYMFSVAYPYGRFNDTVLRITKELGYIDGYSVIQGDNTDLQLNRSYL